MIDAGIKLIIKPKVGEYTYANPPPLENTGRPTKPKAAYTKNTMLAFQPKISEQINTAKVCNVIGIAPTIKLIFEHIIISARPMPINTKSRILWLFVIIPLIITL